MAEKRWGYIFPAGIFLILEIYIALYVRDDFIRPYVGDTLAVILVYCALRIIPVMTVFRAAFASLSIGIAIELAQLAGMTRWFGLGDNKLAQIILGGVFDFHDIAAYGVGACLAAIGDRLVIAPIIQRLQTPRERD